MTQASAEAVTLIDGRFVAVGSQGAVGAVWTSTNGRSWTKEPTSENHFDLAMTLWSVENNGDRVVALGAIREPDGPANITSAWLARVRD